MAMELWVLSDRQLNSIAEWQAAIDAEGSTGSEYREGISGSYSVSDEFLTDGDDVKFKDGCLHPGHRGPNDHRVGQ